MDTHNEQGQTWLDWLDHASGGASERAIGSRIGRGNMYVRRHLKTVPPTPEAAIVFAQAFGHNPALALIKAGYLSAADFAEMAGSLDALAVSLDAHALTTADLASVIEAASVELARRLRPEGAQSTSHRRPAADATTTATSAKARADRTISRRESVRRSLSE
ncbi:hypothetical protein [Nocardia terpenica]|uniref:Uncharacterized protein n=1 Tax=Nocardia terpenica TaxID=455432 RepID=A0A6G9Z7Z2_9NOCA|nr:hypothetical protein [Nocardia terpenica]QIS21286.1 hypothetical protein F6W96_26115 [Nocardia terpenica]